MVALTHGASYFSALYSLATYWKAARLKSWSETGVGKKIVGLRGDPICLLLFDLLQGCVPGCIVLAGTETQVDGRSIVTMQMPDWGGYLCFIIRAIEDYRSSVMLP